MSRVLVVGLVAAGCGAGAGSSGKDGAADPTGTLSSGTPTDDTTPSPPTDPDPTGTGATPTETHPLDPNFSQPGPYTVTVEDGMRTSGVCVTPYRTFWPDSGGAGPVVVLSHGFARTQQQMEDLGSHLASWGVPVVTTTLCHSTPIDNDPDQDAADLVALADEIGAAERIYVGHSAGGLRSVLAGVADPATVAVLGLDLVDVFDLALDASPALTVPFYGLLGEPYSCNSDGNGLPVYDADPGSVPLQVVDADHCDFEAPTDWMCTTFCDQPGATFTDDQIRSVIRGLATAFVAWQAGADAAGEGWWTAGEPAYEMLLASGAIVAR